MAKQKHSQAKPTSKSWRNIISTCFLFLGAALLFSVLLSIIKIDLSTSQSNRQHYLLSSYNLPLSFPATAITAALPSEQPLPAEISQSAPTLPAVATISPQILEPAEQTAEQTAQSAQSNPPAPTPQPLKPSSSGLAAQPTATQTTTPPAEPGAVLTPDQPTSISPAPSAPPVPETALLKPGGTNLAGPTTIYLPIISNIDQTGADAIPADDNKAEEPLPEPPPGAVPGPSAGAVVRLLIPTLKIDRAVVMVGLKSGSGGKPTWNTDSLFSTANRQDLVGQTITSANPGEGGNIILIGHNYNNGWSANGAVFVNLLSLKPGSDITLYTESGKEFHYTVQLVKKVPWDDQDNDELQKHHKYMYPTDHEQLTLVTCGGAYLGAWSARIYAIALPAETQRQP